MVTQYSKFVNIQIAVSPTLFTTTQAAKERFSPEERGCYDEREVMLKHLPYGMYRYANTFSFNISVKPL